MNEFEAIAGDHTNVKDDRMRRITWRFVIWLLAFVLVAGGFLLWASLARFDPFGTDGIEVRAAGEVHLTHAQPVMVVEFEASLETRHARGMGADLRQIRPDGVDELAALASVKREFWHDGKWVSPSLVAPQVTAAGVSTFRFRWILRLADEASDTSIPVEAAFGPVWLGGGDEPAPDETDVSSLSVAIVASHPPNSD